MNEAVLAADLGGTNLRIAAVGPGGEILARAKCVTPRSDRPEDVVSAIVTSARECLAGSAGAYSVRAIGVAIPAMSIDPVGGIVKKAANLPSINGFALGAAISGELGIPALLENDANAAAIGESWTGASKGVKNSICVTLGTGIGGGIILNGSILRGPDWSAGEVGHICVEPLGRPCGCGSTGCVEQYASATAIARMTQELMPGHPGSILAGTTDLTARCVYDAAKQGDDLAAEVFRRMAFYLGIALANLINILNPEVIVIGGGVAESWDVFIGPLREEIGKRAYSEPAKRAKLVPAALGDDAGIIGAAQIAFHEGPEKLYFQNV
jgi:glucokinase